MQGSFGVVGGKGKSDGKGGKGAPGGKGKPAEDPADDPGQGGLAAVSTASTGHRDKLRERCENGLKVLLKILADQKVKQNGNIWFETSFFVWASMLDDLSAFRKGAEKVLAMYLSWARGEYGKVLKRTWDVLEQTTAIEAMGLTVEFTSAEDEKAMRATPEFFKSQSDLAQRAYRSVFHIVRYRLLSMAAYHSSFPGCFVKLVGEPADISAGLEFCRRF